MMNSFVFRVIVLELLLAFVTPAPNKEDWDIYSFHINSTVSSRYATSVITSRVVNRVDQPKEVEFHVKIPKNAFISKFRMLIDGQMYDGVIKPKEEAQQQYTEAVSRGQSAGIVSSVGRTMEEFKTSVTVAAHQKVTFELTYEELLRRRLGKYELLIHARPMQPVSDFKIDVYIQEKPDIIVFDVKGVLSTNTLANAVTKMHAQNQAWVHFYPTLDQQTECDVGCGEGGLNGDLVIVYDVNRDDSMGDIKGSDGYFVHHFAPTNLPRIPKNVVFVIDKSGSMDGRKIQQTREALLHILADLAEDDFFGIITFSNSNTIWKTLLVQANEDNVQAAKIYVKSISSRGGTNINDALLKGAEMLNQIRREGSASLLILLTDGDPTSGVISITQIQTNVQTAINKKFPLYCLGFGFDVKFEFLEKMSLENNGVARRIYEESDAASQLKGFYTEVATPLLTDVVMIYDGATNMTQTNFSQYYNGSEIVVAGQITDNNIETFTPQVLAFSNGQTVNFSNAEVDVESSEVIPRRHIERVWAYLTVKQLLEKELQSSGDEKEKVKKKALELSLTYSFVTPLTSMVVTKPPGEKTQVAHKPKEGESTPVDVPVGPRSQRPKSALNKNYRSEPEVLFSRFIESAQNSHWRPRTRPTMKTRIAYKRLRRPRPTVTTRSGLDSDDSSASVIVNFRTSAPKVAPLQRFLLAAEGQALPLCYDLPAVSWRLSLLQDSNTELNINGEMGSTAGFQKISIHFKDYQHVEIDTTTIRFTEGQRVESLAWKQDQMLSGQHNVTVILRNMEVDVTVGNSRIIILLHERNGMKFLWPVLRQFPSGNNTGGLLTIKPVAYETVPGSTTLRINNQEIHATRISAVDYSFHSTPVLGCWLIPLPSALRRELSDFFVLSV